MADFYPLLDRAISGLQDNTPEARNALFARARDVLQAQLRGMDPPVPDADIEHEMSALEDVIARIEAEQQVKAREAAAAKSGADAAKPAAETPAAAATAARPAPAEAPRASGQAASSAPPASPEKSPPAGKPAPVAAPQPPASNPQASIPQAPRPHAPMPAAGPQAGQSVAAPAPDGAPGGDATSGGGKSTAGSSAPQPKPAMQLGHTGIRPAHGAMPGEGPATGPAKPSQPPVTASPEPAVGARLRPPPPAGKGRRNALVGGVLAVVLIGVGGVAYWANKVQQPAPHPQDVAAEATDAGSDQKFDQRVDAGTAGQQGGVSSGQAVEGAQRAILYEETPDNPQTPKVLQGSVTWRLDSENPGQNEPLENVVRADVVIPEASLDLKITLRRNTDAALPASHLMELSFNKAPVGEGRIIRDVGVPQFKTEENARGVPLAGLPVAVSETVFLVGLSNLPSDVERNVDLIRNRPWIDLPVRYDNGRRAVIALEKGASGDRVMAEAFKSWGVAGE